MAGFYPDFPSSRLPYHKDETVGFKYRRAIGAITQLTATQLEDMNDEDPNQGLANGFDTTGSGDMAVWGLIFPELRTIDHFYCMLTGTFRTQSVTGGEPRQMQTSTNTTNGYDGAWTTVKGSEAGGGSGRWDDDFPYPPTPVSYRSAFYAISLPNIKAIRFNQWDFYGEISCKMLHLYGTGGPVDRLMFWHPTLDHEIAGPTYGGGFLDFGDEERGDVAVKQFRVKNISPALAARDIVMKTEMPYDASPTMVTQYAFSTDGNTYTTTLNIGDLTPGQISGPLYLRESLDVAAQLNPWVPLFIADATEWN